MIRWCDIYQQVSHAVAQLSKLAMNLLVLILFIFFLAGVYWTFLDVAPIIHYGDNSWAELVDDKVLFHMDATRLRDCPVTIKRKIGGCGQVDLPDTIGITPVGEVVAPFSFPLEILYSQYGKGRLRGSVCYLRAYAEGYCNPAQRLLNNPIVTKSPRIRFMAVSMRPEDMQGP